MPTPCVDPIFLPAANLARSHHRAPPPQAIGLCNFHTPALREAYHSLRRLGVPIATNQVRYSIFNIERELDGTLETCLELGIAPVAHTPLAGGLASTFYAHALARRSGQRGRVGRFDTRQLLVLSPLFEAMGAVCEEGVQMRTELQVALRFAMAKGCIPIPGINNAQHAKEAAGALEWELDLAQIEELSAQAIILHSRRRELPWLQKL